MACGCTSRLIYELGGRVDSASVEISTSFPALHIAATYGLGEAVVSGEEFSDEFLLDPTDLKVIKRVKGSKRNEYRVRADRSGIEKVPVSKERQERCAAAPVGAGWYTLLLMLVVT